MKKLDSVIKKLGDRNMSEIARRMRCTRVYIHAIRSGKTKPSKEFLDRLNDCLDGKEN